MARLRFDEKYVFDELENVGNALSSPVTLYLIGGAAMIRYGLKAATKDIDILLHTQKETAELRRCIAQGQLSGIQLRGAAASGIDWNGLRIAARDLAYPSSALVLAHRRLLTYTSIVFPTERHARPQSNPGTHAARKKYKPVK